MSIRIGYLLPPRERITAGQPQAASLLELAERAERLGFDSVWANAPAIADLKATLADFRATLAELRITMAADKTQPLELPPRQRPWWPIRRVKMPALRLHDRAVHGAGTNRTLTRQRIGNGLQKAIAAIDRNRSCSGKHRTQLIVG